MPLAPVNGADLHYEVDGDGPTIVFAHGGEGTHLHWWQQVVAFHHDHRCITYDARGFGLSSRTPSDRGTDVHWLDLLGLLDALDVGRAVLVGQSMGGWAVSGMAQNRPDRVDGLVMADTPFNFATPALSQWAVEMIEKITQGFDVVAACLSPRFAEREPGLAHLFHALSRLNPPRTGPRGLDAYAQMRDQAPGDYTGFAVPTLFIVGDVDALTFPWLIEATAAAVGGARVATVADAGHSAYFERAEAFNECLRGWMADASLA